MVFQKRIELPEYSRGFHLISNRILEVINESRIKNGLVHVFIQHTSAGLSINENADPTVRMDFESFFNQLVPEDTPYFKHNYEGSDDMPAHLKSSLLGHSVSFPINAGRPLLGTWQGVYLCEHRDYGGRRKIVVTIQGE